MQFINIEKHYLIMPVKNNKFRAGVTLIELVVTIIAAIILIIGVTGILAGGHKNYATMYARTTSQVIRNGYEARRIFDRIVRQSTIRRCDLVAGGTGLYVYYYSDPANLAIVNPDRYAAFYLSGTDLIMEQGDLANDFLTTIPPPPPPSLSSGMVIAHNVDSAAASANGIFSVAGSSIRMVLTLDNENLPNNTNNTNKLRTLKMTITGTAIRHNK
jgi:hypothetical protein